MNIINNNVTFGAKLNYTKLSVSKSRWAQIAKEFEIKTKKYPNDIFYLEDNEDIYDLNEPYGYFDVKIKNEIDKQENYFSVKRYKLTIDY